MGTKKQKQNRKRSFMIMYLKGVRSVISLLIKDYINHEFFIEELEKIVGRINLILYKMELCKNRNENYLDHFKE